MTIRDMQIFQKVAECESMSKAAQELFISQSSVSQVIAAIEKKYDVMLFDRLSRKLHITEVGKEMLRHVRHILTTRQSLELYLMENTLGRNVRIGATITVGTCVLSPIVRGLTELLPQLRAEVIVANTHTLENNLLKSEIDVALVEGKIQNPDLICRPVIDDELVLACGRGHPFFGRDSVMITELVNQPLILREKGSGTRAQLDDELRSKGIFCTALWESYSIEAIKNAVIDGHGVTVISKLLLQEEFEQGILWCCDIDGLYLKRSFDLVYHKDKYITKEINSFMSLCSDYGNRICVAAL